MPSSGQVVLALARKEGNDLRLLGTAFAVANRHLATALHTVGHDDSNLFVVLPKVLDDSDYQDTSDTNVNAVRVKFAGVDNFRDLCVLEILDNGQFGLSYQIAGSDELNPGDPVHVFGYPHADHGRMVFTVQPTTVGAKILIPNQGIKSKYLVINTQTRPGQSGSPVFNSRTGRVCAVVVGSYAPSAPGILLGTINPATLHQTSHAISSEYLKAMIP